MNALIPHKVWWTPDEIAAAAMPDMPATPRGAQKLAVRQNWKTRAGCVRRRAGKGGGFEYHYSLFPLRARDWLIASAVKAETDPEQRGREEAWAAFEALDQKAKDKALKRAEICREVLAAQKAGATRTYAVDRAAARHDVGARSIGNWLKTIQRVRMDDWAPALAGKHKTTARKIHASECSEEAWEVFVADVMNQSGAPITEAYERTKDVASQKGWAFPSISVIRRLAKKRVSRAAWAFARKGEAGLEALYPTLERDKTALQAMEGANADFHKFDNWVEWEGEIIRPHLSAICDIFSGQLLAWRITDNPNAATVLLTIGDMVEDFGIPDHMVFDNGREYAAKLITGGTKNRFRHKMVEAEPLGVLPTLGCEVHFTTPFRGQAKPIERFFRDVASYISKDPRLVGSYTGNRPDAKPENYRSRAIPRDEFVEIVSEGLAKLNAREGRRSPTCNGRSFTQTFAASYAEADIRKATPEQRRLWLLGAKNVRAQTNTGAIKFMGNTYWAPWSPEFAGQQVVVRFDPDDLHSGLHIYDAANVYLGHADCTKAVGFFDMDGFRQHKRAKDQWRRAARDMAKAEKTLAPADHARLLRDARLTSSIDINAKVIAPAFGGEARKSAALKTPAKIDELSPEMQAEVDAQRARFKARQAEAAKPADRPETDDERVARCDTVLAAHEAGQTVGERDLAWARLYQNDPDYRAVKRRLNMPKIVDLE